MLFRSTCYCTVKPSGISLTHRFIKSIHLAVCDNGKGWFAIFRIAYPDEHKAQFEVLQRDFANSGLVIDKSCKDVNRMRFISYDPEPYVNEAATLYNKVWVEPKPTVHVSYSGGDMEQVEKCWKR